LARQSNKGQFEAATINANRADMILKDDNTLLCGTQIKQCGGMWDSENKQYFFMSKEARDNAQAVLDDTLKKSVTASIPGFRFVRDKQIYNCVEIRGARDTWRFASPADAQNAKVAAQMANAPSQEQGARYTQAFEALRGAAVDYGFNELELTKHTLGTSNKSAANMSKTEMSNAIRAIDNTVELLNNTDDADKFLSYRITDMDTRLCSEAILEIGGKYNPATQSYDFATADDFASAKEHLDEVKASVVRIEDKTGLFIQKDIKEKFGGYVVEQSAKGKGKTAVVVVPKEHEADCKQLLYTASRATQEQITAFRAEIANLTGRMTSAAEAKKLILERLEYADGKTVLEDLSRDQISNKISMARQIGKQIDTMLEHGATNGRAKPTLENNVEQFEARNSDRRFAQGSQELVDATRAAQTTERDKQEVAMEAAAREALGNGVTIRPFPKQRTVDVAVVAISEPTIGKDDQMAALQNVKDKSLVYTVGAQELGPQFDLLRGNEQLQMRREGDAYSITPVQIEQSAAVEKTL
jgi:hypothetical protein